MRNIVSACGTKTTLYLKSVQDTKLDNYAPSKHLLLGSVIPITKII